MKRLIISAFAVIVSFCVFSCTKPQPETVEKASLSYNELAASASEYVAGYGVERLYPNASGDWTISAYNYKGGFQLNSNKAAYIGTPSFNGRIDTITIKTLYGYSGVYYLCTESGGTSVTGLVRQVRSKGSETTIAVGGDYSRLYIRSSSMVIISSITVVLGGTPVDMPVIDPDAELSVDPVDPVDPDEPEDPVDPVTPDDPVDPVDPVTPSDGKYGWYELPLINDADNNRIVDNDNSLYLAYHQFDMNSKKYRNYTVCYSGDHHCPLWVAAPRHSFYVGSTNRSNAYKNDPDIPGNIQYGSKDTGGGCNKGHMLGSAERTCCTTANQQVFYYSNIAPQLSSGFNTGGGGWNLLEDYIDGLVVKDTLYEVIGCYFEKYTDGYGNTVSPSVIEFGTRNDVDMPTMFYYALLRTKKGTTGKRVADCSADELQCVAFVRSHTNSLKGQKPSSKELMSISDLEKITGVTYFSNVPNAPKSTYKASDWGL